MEARMKRKEMQVYKLSDAIFYNRVNRKRQRNLRRKR